MTAPTTCPNCKGKGYTSAPYLAPDYVTLTACTCPAGDAFRAWLAAMTTKIPEDE